MRGLRALVAGLSTASRSCSRGTVRRRRVGGARQQRDVGGELGELALDRAEPLVDGGERVGAVGLQLGEPLVEPVDAVLDALEALGDRAQAARQPLDVGGRRDVERAQRGLLGLRGLLARLERPRERAVDQRVLQQILRQLAEGVLALLGEPTPQPLVCHGVPPALRSNSGQSGHASAHPERHPGRGRRALDLRSRLRCRIAPTRSPRIDRKVTPDPSFFIACAPVPLDSFPYLAG